MTEPYELERRVALAAVREASRLCQSVQGRLEPELSMDKPDESPVTVADFGAQALICRRLHESFPADPVIGEETADALRADDSLRHRVLDEVSLTLGDPSDPVDVLAWIDRGGSRDYAPRYWTLDPIDGTKGFLRGANYAIALALIEEGQVVLAALAGPNLPRTPGSEETGVVFLAAQGAGAYSYPLMGAGLVYEEESGNRLLVSRVTDPTEARWCESVESAHQAQALSARVAQSLGIRGGPRRLDSMLKYALVARGEAELYLRVPSKPGYEENIWDHAAGALILTEAGGRVTDLAGAPLRFDAPPKLQNTGGLVVSNGPCHEAFLAAVLQVQEEE